MALFSVDFIDATCFDECFLFHLIAGRRYFFSKFFVTARFFQPPYCRFLWNKCFKRSAYFTHLHNNSAVLILMLMLISKKSYPILYLYILEKLSYVADFFYDKFFTLYFFNCSTLLFVKLFLFLKNSKHIWKHVFT